MPWCADCDRYLAPPTVRRDGTCPTCGHTVDVAERSSAPAHHGRETKDALPQMPWHFKALCCAFAVYLGYRFMQMGEWLLHRL